MNNNYTKIAPLIDEISMGPFGSDIKVENFISSGVPVLNGSNLSKNKLVEDNFKYVSEEKAKTYKKAIAIRGDIVVTHRGTLGQISYIPDNSKFEKYVISQSQFRVKLKKDLVDPSFFVYFFHTSEGQKRLLANKCHVGVPALAQATTNFKLIEIPLPKLEIQKYISAVLSSLDNKIELNNRINSEVEAIAKTLYDYWFVQFDFPNEKGKPYKTSGGKMLWSEELKREIPEGWDSIKIDQLLAKESATKKILTSEILTKGLIPVIDQSTDFIAGYTNSIDSVIETVVPRIIFGDHTRILKLINFNFARGADGTQVILSNNKRMPQHLFYHTLLKIDLSNYGYARHYKFLKDQRIILPSKEIAEKFEDIAQQYYKQIKHKIFENLKLAELRDWLLPMLMNGQVKV
jgi:type I restriction enzyme, S subunit